MIIDSIGFSITLVASNSPPRPTSSIVKSAFDREKARSAAQVVISKKVIGRELFFFSH